MTEFILKAPKRVTFDADNREHRAAYVEFVRTKRWVRKDGTYNILFALEEGYTDVPQLCSSKMVEYYASKEFGDAVAA